MQHPKSGVRLYSWNYGAEKSGGFEDPQVLAILNAEVPAEIEPVTSLTAMSVSSVGSSKGAAPGTGSKAGGKIEGKACDSSTIKHIFYNCRDQGITIPTDCP
jgi:hypothetical protein